MKALSSESLKNVKQQIERLCDIHARPIAAFDADGTLWRNDMGEALFEYQIEKKLLPNLPRDPWKHYEDLKEKVSHEVAYLWLAQICAGRPLKEVQGWAQDALKEQGKVPLFEEVRELIQLMHEKKFEVYIVTASIKWAVEPGAMLFGIPSERVVGIRTRVENGNITEEQEGPITYKAGKVSGLLEATGGAAPCFCAGNTEGDLPLLDASLGLRLVLASAPFGDRNYATERRMLNVAQQRNWLAHDYTLK